MADSVDPNDPKNKKLSPIPDGPTAPINGLDPRMKVMPALGTSNPFAPMQPSLDEQKKALAEQMASQDPSAQYGKQKKGLM